MNRLGLFVFFDKDGIVDDYVLYMLNDLKKNINDLIILSNCKLNDQEKSKLEKISDKIIFRENKGLDAGALYEYFNSTDDYKKYDEVVYLNDTFYGPFYPFEKIFDTIDQKKKLDFWGLSLGHKQTYNGDDSSRKIIDDHIQSFLIVFKNKLLNSDAFTNYWKSYDYEHMLSFKNVVDKHETTFTKYLVDNGFKYDCYIVDSLFSNDYKRNFNNYFYSPSIQIINDKAPFIKRKLFSSTDGSMLYLNDCNELRKSMNYIENNTDYDIGLIWKNLLRYYNLHTLQVSYGFDEIIEPSNKSYDVSALILLNNSYYIDEVSSCVSYFKEYNIITYREDIYKSCLDKNIKIKLIKNDDIKSIQNLISKLCNDYLLFLNLSENIDKLIMVDAVACQTAFDNFLSSKLQLNGVVNLVSNKNVSMAYVPENNHYDNFYLNLFWKENLFEYVKNIVPEYKLLDWEQYPVSFNTNFIVKKNVLNHLDFDKWPDMSFDNFVQVLSISLSYYGTFDNQRPIIAYDKDYICYKLNNIEHIYKETYRNLYVKNYMPATYLEVMDFVSKMKPYVSFKKKMLNWNMNHFYYPIRNRFRKLIHIIKRK